MTLSSQHDMDKPAVGRNRPTGDRWTQRRPKDWEEFIGHHSIGTTGQRVPAPRTHKQNA